MLSDLYRIITNAIYQTSFQAQQYSARNGNIPIIAAGATKARKLNDDAAVSSGIGWATARRAVLILTNEKLICGSWEIPIPKIRHATLLRVNSMFAKALILKVSEDDGFHYQFGLQYDPAWERQTVLKLLVEEGRIERPLFLSIFRIAIWMFLLALCGLSIWLLYLDFASDF